MKRLKSRLAVILAFVLVFGTIPVYGAEGTFGKNEPASKEAVTAVQEPKEETAGEPAGSVSEDTADDSTSEDAAGGCVSEDSSEDIAGDNAEDNAEDTSGDVVSGDAAGESVSGDEAQDAEEEPVGATAYNLWIGGTQITDANKDNVPNLVGGSGKLTYDEGTKKGTLTLYGNITAINRTDESSYVISSNGIDLEVDASDATLCLNYADGKNYETGIWCRKDGENGGNLTVKGSIRTFMGRNSDEGLYSDKDMTIKGGSCLEFTGYGSDCMSTRNGSITIESGAYIYSSADATEMFDIRNNLSLNGVVDMIGGSLSIMGNMEMDGGYLRIRKFSTRREIGRINVWRDVQLKDSIVDMEGPRSGALLDCNNLTVNGGKIHLKNTYNKMVLELETNYGKLNLSEGTVVKKPYSCSVQTKGTFPFNERTIIDNSTGNPATEILIEGSGPLPQYHTVTFDGNGKATEESIPASQTVGNGGKAVKPVAPVSDEEFAFDGWYENKECTGAEFNFDTPITADRTLYAKWKSTKKYTVSFNYNDGSGRVFKTSKVISGDAVTSPKSYPEREGWLFFNGWYVDEHCTALYDFSKPVNGDLNIYAGWTNQAKLWVAGVQVDDENHNNEKWTFDLEKKELTLKKYTNYTEGSQLHFGDGGTAYIYAEDMDLTVKGDGHFKYAYSTSGMGGIYVKGGSLTVDGYFTSERMGFLIGAEKNVTVQGGKLEAKGSVLEARGIESGRDIVINGSTINFDMTGGKTRGIYAERGNITVNGGSVSINLTGDDTYGINTDSGAIDLIGGHVNVKVSETGSLPHRAIRAYGGGPCIIRNALDVVKPEGAVLDSGKQFFKTSADGPVYEIELGQEPAPETVTVSFDMCGYGTQVPSQTVVRGGSAAWPEDPSEDGFFFRGWYDNPDHYGSPYTFGVQVWNDLILYAKWEADPEKTRTVSFNMNGKGLDCKPADRIIAIGKKISRPEPDPVEEGWIFKGWYADEALTIPYDFDTPVTSDITLYAKWVEKSDASSRIVRFVMNGHGKQIEAVEVKEGDVAAEPLEPEAEGCVFTGWYTDKECTKRYDFATLVTADLTLYAGWITADPSKPFTISFTDRSSDPYTGIYYNAEKKRYETVYTSKAIKPGILVTNAKGEIMKAGRDYTVKYSNNTKYNAKGNPAKVTVTGKGNYSGKRTAEFFILRADLAKLQSSGVLMVPAQYARKGSKPAAVLYYGSYRLGKKDFAVSDTGKLTETKKLDITGKGNFEGIIKDVEFRALDRSEIAKLSVKTKPAVKEHVYDGNAQTLNISANGELAVTDGEGKALAEGTDFSVTYKDNVNAGKAQVIVRGIGTYIGSSTVTFVIKPDTKSVINAATVSAGDIPFVPGGVEPKLSVSVSRDKAEVKLREGIDYTIKYSKNKGVGTGKYTLSLLGNYKGHAAVTGSFGIVKAKLDPARTAASSPDMTFKKPDKCFSKPFVTFDDVLLKEKKDYTVKYYTDEAMKNELKKLTLSADSAPVYVRITGTGNYDGEAAAVYTVSKITDKVKYNLDKARIVDKTTGRAVAKQEYTGSALKPAVKVQVKNGREWVDVPEADYETAYLNNVQKGKAVIIVRAKTAEAAGAKTGRFTITAKGLNLFEILSVGQGTYLCPNFM